MRITWMIKIGRCKCGHPSSHHDRYRCYGSFAGGNWQRDCDCKSFVAEDGPTQSFRLGIDMIDVTKPDIVEVQIRNDEKVIWVNVNGVCIFRACQIDSFTLTDLRKETV